MRLSISSTRCNTRGKKKKEEEKQQTDLTLNKVKVKLHTTKGEISIQKNK